MIRLGWGEEYTDKWIAQHYYPIHLHEEVKQKWRLEALEEAEAWVNFFRNVFRCGTIDQLGFLLYWGDGSESVEVSETITISIEKLRPIDLYELEESKLLILNSTRDRDS